MQIILGTIFHFLGGFASGSFYIPYKNVRGWSWESFWIAGGFFSWLIVQPIKNSLLIDGDYAIVFERSASFAEITDEDGFRAGIWRA